MDNVMIVSSNEKSIELLCSLIKNYTGIRTVTTTSATRARRYAENNDISVAIINTPLMEEFGTELSLDLSEMGTSVIMIVEASLVDEIAMNTQFSGVLVIQKPVIKNLFYQYFNVQMSVKNRLLGLRKENSRLKNEIEEIKTVDRAKLILMEMEGMGENEAHRWLEKTAMDSRKSRYEVSLEVLRKNHQI